MKSLAGQRRSLCALCGLVPCMEALFRPGCRLSRSSGCSCDCLKPCRGLWRALADLGRKRRARALPTCREQSESGETLALIESPGCLGEPPRWHPRSVADESMERSAAVAVGPRVEGVVPGLEPLCSRELHWRVALQGRAARPRLPASFLHGSTISTRSSGGLPENPDDLETRDDRRLTPGGNDDRGVCQSRVVQYAVLASEALRTRSEERGADVHQTPKGCRDNGERDGCRALGALTLPANKCGAVECAEAMLLEERARKLVLRRVPLERVSSVRGGRGSLSRSMEVLGARRVLDFS